MYTSYYGLNALPFRLTPDPSFIYESRTHGKARAYLDYGLNKREGFLVITGAPGTGKTTLLRAALNSPEAQALRSACMSAAHFDGATPAAAVAAAFGCDVSGRPNHEAVALLQAALLDEHKAGRMGLLAIDDAQMLSDVALDGLRLLADLQSGAQALLQVVLVGQPSLRKRLLAPGLEQLAQRITGMCNITSLDADEVRAYVEHRLRVAGCVRMPPIDEAAIALLHSASAGQPRVINTLCDRLLLLGCLTERSRLTAPDLQTVVGEREQEMALTVDEPEGLLRF